MSSPSKPFDESKKLGVIGIDIYLFYNHQRSSLIKPLIYLITHIVVLQGPYNIRTGIYNRHLYYRHY